MAAPEIVHPGKSSKQARFSDSPGADQRQIPCARERRLATGDQRAAEQRLLLASIREQFIVSWVIGIKGVDRYERHLSQQDYRNSVIFVVMVT